MFFVAGGIKRIILERKKILVFNFQGCFMVTDNACPPELEEVIKQGEWGGVGWGGEKNQACLYVPLKIECV